MPITGNSGYVEAFSILYIHYLFNNRYVLNNNVFSDLLFTINVWQNNLNTFFMTGNYTLGRIEI